MTSTLRHQSNGEVDNESMMEAIVGRFEDDPLLRQEVKGWVEDLVERTRMFDPDELCKCAAYEPCYCLCNACNGCESTEKG